LPDIDAATLNQWLGRIRTTADRIDCRQANLLKATLQPDRSDLERGDVLPHGWHWIYFLEAPRMDQLGRDGHASLGDFLPPVPLPVRMWAGTRLQYHQPIRLEETLHRHSEVTAITPKTGRSGELCFVTVSHTYRCGDEVRLEEQHDIVYREASSEQDFATPPLADTESDRSIVITPTTTLLFRYSALTFNGHRIHYDLDYCREVEGYPGLVVHAPLVATLMLGLMEQHYMDRSLSMIEFRQRAVSPLYHGEPFTIHLRENATGCNLWAATETGRLAATAAVMAG
jgi:3-methylfumaryl-CoA hydratase